MGFIKSILRHRSGQVLLTIGLYLFLAPHLPYAVHQGFYTISLCIKDVLLWMLPITVSFFIASAISSFEKRAPLFLLTLLLFEAISNAASVWYAFGCGHLAAGTLSPIHPETLESVLPPLWRMPQVKPSWWSADKGSFAGIALGLMSVFLFPRLKQIIAKGKHSAETILTRGFARLIPLFILGFIARMYKTHLLQQMSTQYAAPLIWLVIALLSYIIFLFYLGKEPLCPPFFQRVKHLLPATGIAFSSGCSLSTMPWTIEGTAKNLQNPDLAKALIPATTNIQQVGDCITNCFFCFLIYTQFYGHPPDIATWSLFSCIFVLARFATAAVIGGAIFIMLPIYESFLHFTPEMLAIILALNVILDPLVTSSNVIANGALCHLFEKTWRKINRPKSIENTLYEK